MTAVVYLGEERLAAVPADCRGLAYGDGLFETMRVHGGAVPWLDAHWSRLEAGATRLGLPLPRPCLAHEVIQGACASLADAVLRLVVSRGGAGRGYAPGTAAAPLWILSTHAAPAPPRAGLRLRWCDLRLGQQPALAGLKHCNRLEQVLARGEWNDERFDDGLLRDGEDRVVCATSANLFVLRDGAWLTPPVDRCGVAGVCRGRLLQAIAARIAPLAVAEVESADAVFLCNAVRGILPVASLGARRWPSHPALADARARLAACHPAFAADLEIS